ncbi:MAG TPA: PDZ domain-containing protein [Gemmatimonadales bacterium]|nr:PDZ domain-containing protein [Gemmatimonadales bacterium]
MRPLLPLPALGFALAGALLCAPALHAQRTTPPGTARPARTTRPAAPATPAALHSAPVTNVRYEVTFDSATARRRRLHVALSFDAASAEPVLLSLPIWTPGAYEVSNYAHWVVDFAAEAAGRPLVWDKTDPDTWRVRPTGAGPVTVAFDYIADTLDNAMAWARPDFAFFNGTNVFLYPEGRSLDYPATVTVKTQPGWRVVTSMRPRPGVNTWGESNYHDLVDMPFFVGRFDVDSQQVAGKWQRLATYPAGRLQGPARAEAWRAIAAMAPAEGAVFADTPWPDYTTMMVFPDEYPGGSALEHSRSHLGVYTPQLIGQPLLYEVTAHEMFHSWNVKRLRPADMWPYEYDRAMPTPWLWVSEGITDYYAALAMTRGGIGDSSYFYANLTNKITNVVEVPPVALEDASLSTWIHPQDGTGYLYYPKGALAGFLLDILIRDASDNQRSLDTVMRELYATDYKQGRGFTGDQWWAAVRRAAGGRTAIDLAEFQRRYVDGRDPYPFARLLPLAGLRIEADSSRVARVGIQTAFDSAGARVTGVVPGGMAEAAGVQPGDLLVSLGDVRVGTDQDFGAAYRQRYGTQPEGTAFPIGVRRGAQTLTLPGKVHYVVDVLQRVTGDPSASPKAVRIRAGIMRGR